MYLFNRKSKRGSYTAALVFIVTTLILLSTRSLAMPLQSNLSSPRVASKEKFRVPQPRQIPLEDQLLLPVRVANLLENDDLIQPAFRTSDLSGDSMQQVNNRVKRNRPKFRYNRNKDIVRDY